MSSDLRVLSGLPGGFTISLTNLYDEVLQAEEEIDISISYEVQGSTSLRGTVRGNRMHLRNPFQIQGGNLLTIEPESSAVFFVQIDHATAALWEHTGLDFYTEKGFPLDLSWFQSGQIPLVASGMIKAFKGVAPIELTEVRFAIDYYILVGSPFPAAVDSLNAVYDAENGEVSLTWQTAFEFQNHGFIVEKGMMPPEYPFVDPQLIPGKLSSTDTTYYTYLDTVIISSGIWYYRLQRWYDFGFIVWPLEPTDPVSVVIP